jgi:hypothetical protein
MTDLEFFAANDSHDADAGITVAGQASPSSDRGPIMKRPRPRPARTVIIAATATLLLGVGAAVAAVAVMFNPSSVSSPGAVCSLGYVCDGPNDVPGPAGPATAGQGEPNVSVIQVPGTGPTVAALCPSGEDVIGGGGRSENGSPILESQPIVQVEPESAEVQGWGLTVKSGTAVAYVICSY